MNPSIGCAVFSFYGDVSVLYHHLLCNSGCTHSLAVLQTIGDELWAPIGGGYKNVPEFMVPDEPCRPFLTDVWYLGVALQQRLLDVQGPFASSSTVTPVMTKNDPMQQA